MEDTTNIHHHDGELEPEQDLSFGDLPLFLNKEPERNTDYHDDQERRNSFSSQDFFEFSPPDDQNTKTNLPQDIIFFGRDILHKTKQSANSPNRCIDRTNSRKLFSRSPHLLNRSIRSPSLHIETSKPSPTTPSTGSFRDPYSSNNSRKLKVLIGLPQIPPKMELSDIKKRQSRQAPAPMIPAAVLAGDEKSLVKGINRSGKSSQKNRGEFAKPFKCRTYLSGSFTKACFKGCIPLL